jgi:lysophospholipase L1-like esterase
MSSRTVALYKTDTDAIMAEILSLRSTDDTIIRATTWPFPWINEWKSESILEEVHPYFTATNEYVIQAASEYNIPVARVDWTFNGPDGHEDPEDKGYLAPDRFHPNQVGWGLIADLFRELRYEPLAP